MNVPRPARWALRIWTWLALAFLYLPLLVIGLMSFNTATSLSWPPAGLTTRWWSSAWQASGPREALWNSVVLAGAATAIALVLGTLAAFGMQRYAFFGKQAVSFMLVLPISLPGIVTAIALRNTFDREIDLGLATVRIGFGFRSLVIAHATFCIVVAYNNVVARLRRSSPNLLEAAADLGAHGSQTFRLVTFPLIRSALLSGGILAFALSFDEIVVTTFAAGSDYMTVPQWIVANVARPNNVPLVNVMAATVMVLSIPLAYLAQRLADSDPGR